MTEPNMEWEEEFDERFGVIRTPDYDGGMIPFSEQYSAEDHKDFIRHAIQEAEQRGYEKGVVEERERSIDYQRRMNSSLRDIASLIH